MNDNKKAQLVEAIATMDTTQLEQLVNNCGGIPETLEFLKTSFLFYANNEEVKIEAASTFLAGIQKQLERIERQREGQNILSKITTDICN